MEVIGKLVEKLELKQGVSKQGKEWQIQEFLISVQSGNYENKIKLQAKDCNYQIGAELKCQLNIKASEYNGKWYNSIEAWKIESDSKASASNSSTQTATIPIIPDNDSENLPF